MRWVEESPRLPLQPLDSLAGREPALAEIARQAAAVPGLQIAIAADAHAAALERTWLLITKNAAACCSGKCSPMAAILRAAGQCS